MKPSSQSIPSQKWNKVFKIISDPKWKEAFSNQDGKHFRSKRGKHFRIKDGKSTFGTKWKSTSGQNGKNFQVKKLEKQPSDQRIGKAFPDQSGKTFWNC